MNEKDLEDKVFESKAILRHDALRLLKQANWIIGNPEALVKQYYESVKAFMESGDISSEAYSTAACYAANNRHKELAIDLYKRSGTFWALQSGAELALKSRNYKTALEMYKMALPKANGQSSEIYEKILFIEKKLLKS